MAENFLSQLLTTENRVESKEDGRCSVCLQVYGTLTDTGAIECEVRLPCNHILGSMCPFTWLNSHNTCPFCRSEFFPAQPRPYLEHGIMGHETPNLPVATEWPEILDHDEGYLLETVRHCCSTPYYNDAISSELFRMAEPMAKALRLRVQIDDFGLDTIAGTTVYITSHLLGHPRSPLEISEVVHVDERQIRSLYTHVYADREALIDSSMLELLGRGRMDDVLTLLLPSDSDEEVIRHENEASRFPVNARLLRTYCCHFCHQLGHRGSVVRLAEQIAEKIRQGSYPGICLHITITAVSIFMALHLVGLDTSFEQIQHLTGVAASTIQDSYHRLYPHRNRLITSGSLEYIGTSRVLGALTSLPWPPLHPEITDDAGQNDGLVEGDDTINTPTQDDEVSQIYKRECDSFCTSLGLCVDTSVIAHNIAITINSEDRVDASHLSITAVSIYIATRITGSLVSFDDISAVIGLRSDAVGAFYQTLAHREEIIEEFWLDFIRGHFGETYVGF